MNMSLLFPLLDEALANPWDKMPLIHRAAAAKMLGGKLHEKDLSEDAVTRLFPLLAGRVVQVVGGAGSGKTMLAVAVAAKVLRDGGKVLYVDWSGEISPEVLAHWGIDDKGRANFFHIYSNEQIIGIKTALSEAAEPADLIVLDGFLQTPVSAVPGDVHLDFDDLEGTALWSDSLPALAASGTTTLVLRGQEAKEPTYEPHVDEVDYLADLWKGYPRLRLRRDEESRVFGEPRAFVDYKAADGTLVGAGVMSITNGRLIWLQDLPDFTP